MVLIMPLKTGADLENLVRLSLYKSYKKLYVYVSVFKCI